MRLIEALLKNRGLVLGATALLLMGGVVAFVHLPIDAFPDVTNTQVMVLAEAPGLAAGDVEERVSYPIEQVMGGLPRVQQVRSLSKAGLSQVVVVFDDGVESAFARQLVFERLSLARPALPPGVEPELGPLSTGLGEILQYTLTGTGKDPLGAMELRSVQDWLVAPLLRPLRGVNEINSFGGEVKQYQVLVKPERLLRYGLTLTDVVAAVSESNANAAGGVLVRGAEQVYLRGVGLLRDIPDLEGVVLTAHNGTPVRVGDVADVVIGAAPRQGAVSRDGQGEVVAGMIVMLKGENAAEVVARVKTALANVERALPAGVRLDVFYDRTALIEACLDTVLWALGEGGIFVILVLFLFVAELRTALIVLFSLPLTFLASFIVMGAAGLTANLMSLGGLAFSVGMVVDASIVVVENVRRHLAEAGPGVARRPVVAAALAEVARPVGFSVVIIALILVPLFALQGIEGKLFAPLAATLLIALLLSLGVALTVTPVLADTLLRARPEREFGFIRALRLGYGRSLARAVRRPAIPLGLAGAALVAAAALVPLVGTAFMPVLDEGALAINVVRLPNASLAGSVQVAQVLERRLRALPEVLTVVSKTGRAEISEDPMGPEQSDLIVMLKPRRDWPTGRTKAELVAAMQAELADIPGLRFSFSQPIALRVNELISGVKGDLAVKVFGPDLGVLKDFSDRAAAVLRAIEGAADVKVEPVAGMRQLDIVIDRAAAARHGIRVADINVIIEAGVAGAEATTLIEAERRVAVVVRFAEPARANVAALKSLLVPTPAGARVPLGELATFDFALAPAQVSRESGLRRVVTEVNVRERDLGGFVAEAQAALRPLVAALPAGYVVGYGGQFENQERAMATLTVVVPVVLLLIGGLLVLALGSVGQALLVLLNLPFALVGGVFALVAFDLPLSVSAAIAFIVLLGIAVQNGVVLVAFFRQLRARGLPLDETVAVGAALRFRPLLMTALTSFIGHLPMLYATGSGADIQKPLAVVVMGGLVTSTLLTLFVLPTLYALVMRRRGAPAGA